MISSIKIRWLLVGCVWMAALGLTYWNNVKIDRITAIRETNERLKREVFFEHRNAEKLRRATLTHQSMFLPVASVTLGLVEVKSHLHSLAGAFDLDQIFIKDEMTRAEDGRVPLVLDARGSFQKAVTFLTVLDKYPYLPVTRTQIKAIIENGVIDMSVVLFFQYSLETPDQIKARQLRVNATLSPQGAKPL